MCLGGTVSLGLKHEPSPGLGFRACRAYRAYCLGPLNCKQFPNTEKCLRFRASGLVGSGVLAVRFTDFGAGVLGLRDFMSCGCGS